jgi:hypothetical protein
VGAARIKRMVGKAGTAVGQALWKISVEVAGEAAEKILLGNRGVGAALTSILPVDNSAEAPLSSPPVSAARSAAQVAADLE